METEKLWNRNYIKVWCANFMIFFSFMLLTPLLPLYLSETFQTDKHVIGIVLSGYTIMALITRAFSGFIVDSFPRKIVLLVSYFCFFYFSAVISLLALSYFLLSSERSTERHSGLQPWLTAQWQLMCYHHHGERKALATMDLATILLRQSVQQWHCGFSTPHTITTFFLPQRILWVL